ncbi:hypothetical protein [Fibrobacter sp. UWH4]|uniref:hypothetical protein n=1 Tax=Fibrobacter sp. UWH4 TaxID=1896210 RepID=UPI0009139F9A|nr:hypothetical protein [Fibrobacter sp. UWH4]SHL06113.1 hypothetical protein SAMN05720762_10485 [Fibrobacter sp. UWH4]
MSTELTTPIKIEIPGIGTIESADLYLKSEADKVIAELEESHKKEVEQLLIETKRLENLCASYRHDCDNLAIREANALKEIGRDNRVIRHQKYKRCLAMVRRCENEEKYLEAIAPLFDPDKECWEYNSDYWYKWRDRWLELAEKFKEAK